MANTGISLLRMDIETLFFGRIGKDEFGGILKGLLRSVPGASLHGLAESPGDGTSYTIVLNPPGADRAFLHFPGANLAFNGEEVSDEALEGAAVLHVGYPPLLPRLLEGEGEALARLLGRASDKNTLTSIDMVMIDPSGTSGGLEWAGILANFLPYTDFFMPGLEELEALLFPERFLERKGDDPVDTYEEKEIEELADICLDLGARCVCLKMGKRGIFMKTGIAAPRGLGPSWKNLEIRMPAVPPERFEGTTGAGDAAAAGFIAGVLHGFGPEAALGAAVAAGSFAIEGRDATSGIPCWEKIVKRIPRPS